MFPFGLVPLDSQEGRGVGRALEELVDRLDLEQLETNLFRGFNLKEDRERVFGGQVVGQALAAAGRTVEQGAVHSLHAYFLRPGDVAAPILYKVDRIRIGRSFHTRRVAAVQHGEPIFHLQASFHIEEPGFSHQTISMPAAPPPEALRSWAAWADLAPPDVRRWATHERPIDARPTIPPRWVDATPAPPEALLWIRADGVLPDDPLLHACVAAFASDLTLIDVALAPHGRSWADRELMTGSIDHTMWFHRPFRVDEWLLHHTTSPSANGGLGLVAGSLFRRDGTLVASVVQEGLMRPRRDSKSA